MKKLIALALFILSTSAMADKCRLSAIVDTHGFDRCVNIVTSFEVTDRNECKQLANSSRETKLFGILEGKEEVLRITYTYKKKTSGYKEKVKEKISFVSEDEIDNACMIFGF